MLLIDAGNINSGGAKTLLETLIGNLIAKHKEFLLVKDERYTPVEFRNIHFINAVNYKLGRKRLLKEVFKKYPIKTALYLGNYPPPFVSDIKSYTYFHNLNLIHDHNSFIKAFIFSPLKLFKTIYLKRYLINSEYYIFQSDYVREKFIRYFSIDKNQCLVLPFFSLNELDKIKKKNPDPKKIYDFCYISIPYKHKNYQNLLNACLLLRNKYKKNYSILVTVPEKFRKVYKEIEALKGDGLNIINVGNVSYEQSVEYTLQSKYCVFPSIKETIGLGMLEAALLDVNVICSNLPYVTEVIKPSMTFDPNDIEDIAYKMNLCLTNNIMPKSIPLIDNKIDELIKMLYDEG